MSHGINSVVLVEPLAEPVAYLKNLCKLHQGYKIIQGLCSDVPWVEHTFYIASNGGQSSSIFEPTGHINAFKFVDFPATKNLRQQQ